MDENPISTTAPTDRQLAPVTTVTLADYIYPALQKQYIAILTHEADVLADGNSEAVHQMRVSLRRLRSLLRAFAPIAIVPRAMSDKQIAKIAKILGKVRDLDVLQHTCEHYQASVPDAERLLLAQVQSKIDKRHRKATTKAQALLGQSEYQHFKLALNDWLNHPQYNATIDVPIESSLPNLLLSAVGKLLLAPGWWVNFQPETATEPEVEIDRLLQVQGKVLHDLRKQVKATRYLLELFPDRYSPAYTNYLQDFKQIHQLLGNLQDSAILDGFIQRILGKRAATKLPQMYAQLASQNYWTWQEWQPLQQRYQQLATKHKLQSLLLKVTIHNS